MPIKSKYHGPTNHRGSRISVDFHNEYRRYYDWDFYLNPSQNHLEAIRKYLEYRNLRGRWVYADTHTGFTVVQLRDNNVIYVDGHWPDGQQLPGVKK